MKNKAINFIIYIGLALMAVYLVKLFHLPERPINDKQHLLLPQEVVQSPHQYFNQQISVVGKTTDAYYFGLTGCYRLFDEQSGIGLWVVTTTYPPAVGDTVLVTGELKAVYKVVSSNGVLLRESSRETATQPLYNNEAENYSSLLSD